MSRPGVSVVMPFAGSAAEAQRALDALLALEAGPDDELILSDNSGVCPPSDRVTVVRAAGESSPSHARNVGAEYASRDWVLFLDADCRAEPQLIENYLAHPVADEVGALAGEVVPASQGFTFAARYGAARSFLGQSAHLAHSYMPRAVAANLLVRRSAFEQIGGFYEGVRAA
jgi:GT2 family glycosyltransferase